MAQKQVTPGQGQAVMGQMGQQQQMGQMSQMNTGQPQSQQQQQMVVQQQAMSGGNFYQVDEEKIDKTNQWVAAW